MFRQPGTPPNLAAVVSQSPAPAAAAEPVAGTLALGPRWQSSVGHSLNGSVPVTGVKPPGSAGAAGVGKSASEPSPAGGPAPGGQSNAAVVVESSKEEKPPVFQRAVIGLVSWPEMLVKALRPSNDRDWEADMMRTPFAEFHGDLVTVHNIRNCEYRTADDYTVHYYDATFDLRQVRSVDFIVVPFLASPSLAHLMASFGFADGRYLGLSVEIRREKGERYMPLKGILNQYELIYVIGDERDLIKQCTDVYLNGVYLYRSNLSPEEARLMFVDVLRRANKLAMEPEFYNTFTNNCTTNLIRHVNRLPRRELPYTYHVLLPGYFDRLLYDAGLIENDRPFEQVRQAARINMAAYLAADSDQFSRLIRGQRQVAASAAANQ